MGFPRGMCKKYGSHRNFKQLKRKQLRAVVKALDDLRFGCAYLERPAYRTVIRLDNEASDLKEQLSVKTWGR